MFSRSAYAILDFDDWLGELPHRHKVVVPGNHELILQANPARRSLILNATVLIDEAVAIEGFNIWGSPVTPLLGGAFGIPSSRDRTRHWARIPEDLHVLITHGPPFGILDRSPGEQEFMGDPELRDAVHVLRPKLHVFGHVHGGYGQTTINETLFVNCALMGPHGGLTHAPVVIRMPRS